MKRIILIILSLVIILTLIPSCASQSPKEAFLKQREQRISRVEDCTQRKCSKAEKLFIKVFGVEAERVWHDPISISEGELNGYYFFPIDHTPPIFVAGQGIVVKFIPYLYGFIPPVPGLTLIEHPLIKDISQIPSFATKQQYGAILINSTDKDSGSNNQPEHKGE